jgi:hypothetical protein
MHPLTLPSWIDPIATLRQHQRPLQLCFQVCVNLPAHTHTPLLYGFLFYDFPLSTFVLWTQAIAPEKEMFQWAEKLWWYSLEPNCCSWLQNL